VGKNSTWRTIEAILKDLKLPVGQCQFFAAERPRAPGKWPGRRVMPLKIRVPCFGPPSAIAPA
jgi:hypothetical protein